MSLRARLASLLSPLALPLVLVGCLGASSDDASAVSEISEAPPWHSEVDVANAAAYEEVLEALARAERGSFVSDHPKTRRTKQGRDVSIAYAVVRAPREQGAVVVANGRTESFSHYAELAWDLTRRGYTLYMIDHRGQGHSSRLVDYDAVADEEYQKGHVDDFQDYVDDFAKFVDTVVQPDRADRDATGPLYALGHSMGGAIVTLYAEQHPETFAKIALSSPMHKIDASGVAIGFARTLAVFDATGYAIGKGPRDDAEPFEDNGLTGSKARFVAKRTVWAEDPETKIGGPTYGWIARASHATKTLQRNAAKIEAPVLLLEGTEDEVVAPEGHHAVCNAINAAHPASGDRPACQLVELEGSQHEPLIESDGVRRSALDEIDAFFAEP